MGNIVSGWGRNDGNNQDSAQQSNVNDSQSGSRLAGQSGSSRRRRQRNSTSNISVNSQLDTNEQSQQHSISQSDAQQRQSGGSRSVRQRTSSSARLSALGVGDDQIRWSGSQQSINSRVRRSARLASRSQSSSAQSLSSRNNLTRMMSLQDSVQSVNASVSAQRGSQSSQGEQSQSQSTLNQQNTQTNQLSVFNFRNDRYARVMRQGLELVLQAVITNEDSNQRASMFYFNGSIVVRAESQEQRSESVQQEPNASSDEFNSDADPDHRPSSSNEDGPNITGGVRRLNEHTFEMMNSRVDESSLLLRYGCNLRADEGNDSNNVYEIPLMIVGARDESLGGHNGVHGWLMYIIGGTDTQQSFQSLFRTLGISGVDQASTASSNSDMEAVVRGLVGRFVIGLNAAVTSTLRRAAQQQNASQSTNTSRSDGDDDTDNQDTADNNDEDWQWLDHVPLSQVLRALFGSILRNDNQTQPGMLLGDGNVNQYEFYTRLGELLGPAVPRNAPPELVSQIPTTTYQELGVHIAGSHEGVLSKKCTICLSLYEKSDNLRVLSCHHYFHQTCIDTWLTDHVNSCPLCRKPAVESSESNAESNL
ncbi:hypothetical protein MIR68_000789 [Amoeboaphelidium protococcarum]|nr:hypothetical protein MIR68_000789 [Amoeboaphelidium protococcarum]